jgi:hypothetical protein
MPILLCRARFRAVHHQGISSPPEYVTSLTYQALPDSNDKILAVAETIRANAETYNAAVLGMDREAYIHTILKPNTWGGAIELSALAAHYGTEIASIDVETGRVDKFEPPQGAQQRCILVYSGIHYDAATLAPMADAPAEWHQTLFPVVCTNPRSVHISPKGTNILYSEIDCSR